MQIPEHFDKQTKEGLLCALEALGIERHTEEAFQRVLSDLVVANRDLHHACADAAEKEHRYGQGETVNRSEYIAARYYAEGRVAELQAVQWELMRNRALAQVRYRVLVYTLSREKFAKEALEFLSANEALANHAMYENLKGDFHLGLVTKNG